MPSITPFLWFDTDLAEPISFYTSIFPDAASPEVRRTVDDGPIFTATIELCGQRLMLLNGGPIHADSKIRAAFVGNDVVRLEVQQHACPPAPEFPKA